MAARLSERFDLYGALYLFLTQYHSGQWSRGYRLLCRLQRRYKPGLTVQSGRFETPEMRWLYHYFVRHYKDKV
jgi:hypothetical protein